MIFATPTHTIRTYATLRAINWRPAQIYLNSVSATDTFMTLAVANSNAATVNGSISVQYLKDPASPDNANDAGVNLYKQIMGKYLPNARVTDGLYLYGFAKGRSFCNLLDSIPKGKLTRPALMAKANNFTETNAMNPWFLPGVTSTTSKNDKFPISAERLIEFENGGWKPIGRWSIRGRRKTVAQWWLSGTARPVPGYRPSRHMAGQSSSPRRADRAGAEGSLVDARDDPAFAIRSAVDQVPELDSSEIVDVMLVVAIRRRQGMNLARRAACWPTCRRPRAAPRSTGSRRACRRFAWPSTSGQARAMPSPPA